MTAVLESADTRQSAPSPPRRGTWASTWALALRLARRDLTGHRARSLLMVLLVALPVAAVGGGLTLVDMKLRATDPAAVALRSIGDASARISVTRSLSPVSQNLEGTQAKEAPGAPGAVRRPAAASYETAVRPVVGNRPLFPITTTKALVIGERSVRRVAFEIVDTAQQIPASTYRVVAGRLPARPNEIAVAADPTHLIGSLQAGMGERVEIRLRRADVRAGRERTSSTSATVVGLFDRESGILSSMIGITDSRDSIGAVAVPGWLTDPEASPARGNIGLGRQQFLVGGSPVSWADVLDWNQVGLLVTSRAVLTEPPPGCEAGYRCPPGHSADDTGWIAVGLPSRDTAYGAGIAAIVGALAVLQVALLAGPAFAVSLRSRQRDLGLLAVNGADARILRRQMLALGLVVGVAGGVLGFAIGYGAAWTVTVVGGIDVVRPALPPPWWSFVPVMVIAVVCALVAAWVPARVAGRTEVVSALSGRPHRPPRPLRMPVIGMLLLAVSLGLVLWRTTEEDPLALTAAILAGQLGLIALTPVVVAGIARASRRFPLSVRLAARDLDRNRLRTASAVAAGCAAMSVACTALVIGVSARSDSVEWGGAPATKGASSSSTTEVGR